MIKYRIFDNMERCTEEEVQRLLLEMDEKRRDEALRYKHLAGRFACLKSYAMLWEMLREDHVIEPGQLPDFVYNPHGKPRLADVEGVHFNISHCPHAIAVMTGNMEVGIDVERYVSPSESLLNYTMNDDEIAEVKADAMAERAFARLWTRKEALGKLYGTGLTKSMKVMLNDIDKDIVLRTWVNEEKKYACTLAYYRQDAGTEIDDTVKG